MQVRNDRGQFPAAARVLLMVRKTILPEGGMGCVQSPVAVMTS